MSHGMLAALQNHACNRDKKFQLTAGFYYLCSTCLCHAQRCRVYSDCQGKQWIPRSPARPVTSMPTNLVICTPAVVSAADSSMHRASELQAGSELQGRHSI